MILHPVFSMNPDFCRLGLIVWQRICKWDSKQNLHRPRHTQFSANKLYAPNWA